MSEPLLARFHAATRVTRLPQTAAVRLFRRYFERAPGWVLLTTTGRKTGLPREVLLPCERFADGLYVISTYADRSDWMRNLRRDPAVRVTCSGWVVAARAEVLEDVAARQALVAAHPFFPPAPVGVVNLVHRTVLRPLTVAFLRRWVRSRPVVVVRPCAKP
jgi:deazaflavin-dependent oxidoreductase (nitroreductase family)